MGQLADGGGAASASLDSGKVEGDDDDMDSATGLTGTCEQNLGKGLAILLFSHNIGAKSRSVPREDGAPLRPGETRTPSEERRMYDGTMRWLQEVDRAPPMHSSTAAATAEPAERDSPKKGADGAGETVGSRD